MHKEQMNMNRMVCYYRKHLGKEYVNNIIKDRGLIDGLVTLKIVSKLNKKIKSNSKDIEELNNQLNKICPISS
jgi:hypothetical protein